MSFYLLNRDPEPNEIGIPQDSELFVEIVCDDIGESPVVAGTIVWVASEGGGWVLAFNGGAFQPGFDDVNSYFSVPGAGRLRVNIDMATAMTPEEHFKIRVASETDGAPQQFLDIEYTFQVEDTNAPMVLTVEPQSLRVVRVTFDEPVVAVDATAAGDALNPANYTFAIREAPCAEAAAASVVVVDQYAVDITANIELSPGRQYRLTVANVEDTLGNVVAAPFNWADFVAFEPPRPETREFDLYEMLPEMNRREDDTQDLMKFCSVLQEVTDLLLWDIDRFPDSLDPDFADESFVNAMLNDLGNPFAFVESSSLIDKRRLLRVLVDIYKLKGTARGIIDTVRFFLGLEVTIDQFIDDVSMTLGESELGGDGTDGEWVLGPSSQWLLYAFTVVAVVVLTDQQRERIRAIVEYIKPPHTHYMGTVEPTAPIVIDHVELGLSELGETWELH